MLSQTLCKVRRGTLASLMLTACMLTSPAFSQQKMLPDAPQPQSSDAAPTRWPQYQVSYGQKVPPLNAGGKLGLAALNSASPLSIVGAAGSAGIAQMTDQFPGYGDGGHGYAKRFGAALLDESSHQFFRTFFFPTFLEQDPRYFRMGEGTKGHRFAYAVTRVVVTRNDNGKNGFNWSELLGSLTAGGFSNAYYPESSRGLNLTLGRAGAMVGGDAARCLFKEFWPDIRRKLAHNK